MTNRSRWANTKNAELQSSNFESAATSVSEPTVRPLTPPADLMSAPTVAHESADTGHGQSWRSLFATLRRAIASTEQTRNLTPARRRRDPDERLERQSPKDGQHERSLPGLRATRSGRLFASDVARQSAKQLFKCAGRCGDGCQLSADD